MRGRRFLILPVLAATRWVQAQTQPIPPTSFDVASVKPVADLPNSIAGGPVVRHGCRGGPGSSDPGRLTCNAVSFAQFVIKAHHLQPYQFNCPDWMKETYYNIVAKIPEGSTPEQVRLMEQNLLSERFKLAAHFEKKEMPAYELKVRKDGPKCKKTMPGPSRSPDEIGFGDYQERGGLVGHKAKQTMEELAFYLNVRLGRPVFDATGLMGTYEIVLTFEQNDMGPSLINAVQAQLGLKLEVKKHMIDTLVIDHAEKIPIDN